ncbi:MAG: phosphoglycerate kinase [Actinobacteria bacterium]|nr:phosphoglycerate kinase [Actinomycetota bacterium]|tara:strand:+ start:741 stop:1940 length:1200 start_codon:yes stop_codon:yes gene_type:complete
MQKTSIEDLSKEELNNKIVLIRVDFNVPFENGIITDDSRIKAALPTLEYLLQQGSRCVIASHLGRPKGKKDPSLSLAPIASHLSTLIKQDVFMCNDSIGNQIKETIKKQNDTKLFLLENVRFYEEEENNNETFAKELASLADIFVQDAFGTAHRAHASTAGIANYLPAYAGLLVKKELTFLQGVFDQPEKPLLAIVGGAKVSTKIGVLNHLLDTVDYLVIGGGMAFTFLKAQGYAIGKSLCEDDKCDLALALLDKALTLNKSILLPLDLVVSTAIDDTDSSYIVDAQNIPENTMGLDVGPQTIEAIESLIKLSKTVLWNGPLGVFEVEAFSKGTCEVAKQLATSNAITIIGGGDSVAAVHKVNQAKFMSHISTGGGACLEYLEGKELPGIACLKEKETV